MTTGTRVGSAEVELSGPLANAELEALAAEIEGVAFDRLYASVSLPEHQFGPGELSAVLASAVRRVLAERFGG